MNLPISISKGKIGLLVNAVLIVALVGLIAGAVAPVPKTAARSILAAGESPEMIDQIPLLYAVQPTPGLQTARPDYCQPVTHWYKNKQWWKRNAPIIGGAAGGGLVGGLVGGGKGAVIGGALGGGGGYLYKRSKHHHHYNQDYNHHH
jgi:hypothetical protein